MTGRVKNKKVMNKLLIGTAAADPRAARSEEVSVILLSGPSKNESMRPDLRTLK